MLLGNNREEIIEFERIEDISILSNFYCGIEKMDSFIHNLSKGLQSYIDSNPSSNTYIAKLHGEIVALFSILSSYVILDEDDKEDMFSRVTPKPEVAFVDQSFLKSNRFDALEIAYLAVREDKRQQGIGETIVAQIIKRANSIIDNCEFIKVDAYYSEEYSAVGFYEKLRFQKNTPLPIGDIWPMFYVINPHIFKDEDD